MNPLFPFRALPTNVEHSVCQVLDDECSLGDTGRLDSRSQNVLIVGEVVVGGDAVDGIEVAIAWRQ